MSLSVAYNQVNFDVFRASSNTERFMLAVNYLRENPYTELVIPEGTYEITSELAKEAMYKAISGEWGSNPQPTMFNPKYEYTRGISFDGVKNCIVSAYGAVLLVDGFMEPVSLINCADVELRGLTIDHKRKPYSKGTLVSAVDDVKSGTCECIIELDKECPIYEKSPIDLRYFFYDPHSSCGIYPSQRSISYVDTYHIKAVYEINELLREGIEYYTVHTYHSRPAVLIENAENIRLTDVTVHSQPGMGIVGNRSENVIITRLKVVPSEGHHMSTNTDATHFASMKGLLRFEDCIFGFQGDDSANVHAYFQTVIGREGVNTYFIREKTPDGTHAQTLDYPDIGDEMELSSHDTLESLGYYKVIDCVPMPDEWKCRVTFDRPLPQSTEGLVLADVTRLPRVEFVGCKSFCHFARGVLIKTRDALIEGNTFVNVCGTAIVAAAESWWYEGVCPANIIIRKNHVISCDVWGNEVSGIFVKADCNHAHLCSIYNIQIEDNIIESPFSSHGIYVRNTDGLIIRRNSISCSDEPIVIESCKNCTVSE